MGGEHLSFSFLLFLAFCVFLFGSLVGAGVTLVLRQSRLSPGVAIRAAFFSGLAMATGENAYNLFFNIWKEADPDLPRLKDALAEYARFVGGGAKSRSASTKPAAGKPHRK